MARRLARHGRNELPGTQRRGWLVRFLSQFNSILLYVMMAAAVVTAALGHWIDTGVLFGAVVLNAVIGFVQERRAESALDAIRAMLSPHATVIRSGQRRDVDASGIVPGDLVVLKAGGRVPADVRLISVHELRVDESALTGESVPVQKSTAPVDEDAPLGDRGGMAYSGTVVVFGQATGVVVATGVTTELGSINAMLAGVRSVRTPLLTQVDRFGRVLAIVILGAAALTYVFGVVIRGLSPSEMFMMAVALIASAIPEGLPAIMTITLALGVQRMARRRAIVRRLPAVETLGSVSVVCSDKTGTLTRNEMTVQRVAAAGRVFDVGGVGYAPIGEFNLEGEPVDVAEYPVLELMMRAVMHCNDARLREREGLWRIEGDPTEGALLVAARKAGLDPAGEETWPRVASVPFASERRFMATGHQAPDGSRWHFMKGAPERLLELCTVQAAPGGGKPIDAEYWHRVIRRTAAQGLRVLAVAYRKSAKDAEPLSPEGPWDGFEFLGLLGLMDPPREEAILAIEECQRAGIRVKMITGDHTETAMAIGAQLNIGVGTTPLTGTDIEELDDAELREAVREVDVFARASPEHKLRLVQALQRNGEVVAMTGDGVNDSPALKRSDVGVAMGRKGTDAAKEAADMIITDDNFATIAAAVEEGRTVHDNLKKFVLFMLPTNGGEALVVIAAILFAFTLPLTPVQVLWINLVTSSTLGVALAFEPPEPDVMARRPRPRTKPFLGRFFIWRVAMVSVLMATGALGLFLWEERNGSSVETARTLAVNAVVAGEMFYLLTSRRIFRSVLDRSGLVGNPVVLLAFVACIPLQLLFTYLPFMHTVFDSAPLDALDWAKVLGVGLLVFMGAELEKLVLRKTRRGARLIASGA